MPSLRKCLSRVFDAIASTAPTLEAAKKFTAHYVITPLSQALHAAGTWFNLSLYLASAFIPPQQLLKNTCDDEERGHPERDVAKLTYAAMIILFFIGIQTLKSRTADSTKQVLKRIQDTAESIMFSWSMPFTLPWRMGMIACSLWPLYEKLLPKETPYWVKKTLHSLFWANFLNSSGETGSWSLMDVFIDTNTYRDPHYQPFVIKALSGAGFLLGAAGSVHSKKTLDVVAGTGDALAQLYFLGIALMSTVDCKTSGELSPLAIVSCLLVTMPFMIHDFCHADPDEPKRFFREELTEPLLPADDSDNTADPFNDELNQATQSALSNV